MSEFTSNDGSRSNGSMWNKLRDFFTEPTKPKIEIKPKITVHTKPSGEITFNQPERTDRHPEKITINDVSYSQMEFNGRTINWFRQKNGWDCGPCMCLNMQNLLRKTNLPAAVDVDNFRIWAENQTMMLKTRRIIRNRQVVTSTEKQRYTNDMDTEWLNMEDVRNYVKDCLYLKEVAIENTNTLKEVANKYSGDRDIFVWGISQSHYRGYFLDRNGSVYSIDSFKNGPETARIDDVFKFFRESTGICFTAVGLGPETITMNNQNR